MAGSFFISKDSSWGPAGWIFDNAFQGIARNLAPVNKELSDRFAGSTTLVNGGFLDLEDVDSKETFQIVLDALEKLKIDTIPLKDGFVEEAYFDGYMKGLDGLGELLKKRIEELS